MSASAKKAGTGFCEKVREIKTGPYSQYSGFFLLCAFFNVYKEGCIVMNIFLGARQYRALVFFFSIVVGLSLFQIAAASAQTTTLGRVIYVQGHEAPACRGLKFQENGSTTPQYFRIPNSTLASEDTGIMAVLLTALVSDRDVQITYDPNLTTGCGSEPKVMYVTIY